MVYSWYKLFICGSDQAVWQYCPFDRRLKPTARTSERIISIRKNEKFFINLQFFMIVLQKILLNQKIVHKRT